MYCGELQVTTTMVSTHTSRATVVLVTDRHLGTAVTDDLPMEVNNKPLVGTGTLDQGEAAAAAEVQVSAVEVDLTWASAAGRGPRGARDRLLEELLTAGVCLRVRRDTAFT